MNYRAIELIDVFFSVHEHMLIGRMYLFALADAIAVVMACDFSERSDSVAVLDRVWGRIVLASESWTARA